MSYFRQSTPKTRSKNMLIPYPKDVLFDIAITDVDAIFERTFPFAKALVPTMLRMLLYPEPINREISKIHRILHTLQRALPITFDRFNRK